MQRIDDHPVRFSMRGHPRMSLLGAVAAAALLAGCAATPAAEKPPTASLSAPTASANESMAAATTESAQTAQPTQQSTPSATPIGTSSWKGFESFGIGFKYPADWKIVPKAACPTCDAGEDPKANPFAVWDINDAAGNNVAVFAANTAADSDGNRNTYARTKLDEAKLATNLKGPAVFIFEHATVTPVEGETTQIVQLMLLDGADAATRGEMPLMSYFSSKPGFVSQLESADGFLKALGLDPKNVGVDEGKKAMESPEYQKLRTLMLSVGTAK